MSTPGSPGASERLFSKAVQLLPGGVSSPVRAFRSVGGTPRYFARGEGAQVWDEDGRSYVDFCLAWGPLILGHAHPRVVEAVTQAARDGLAFGTCHRHEIELAELILEAFAPLDRVRLVVTGTEAVMTAVRLARAKTGRERVLKFSGCYHGHADAMLSKAGSGLVTLGMADSAGVPAAVAGQTVVAPLGDLEALEAVFAQHGSELAAAIVEPIPANNGLLLQSNAFLERLRGLTQASGTQLIFDEVITGFRHGFHGYTRLCGVQPDLVTLGKIVGGGLPVAAVVGSKALIDQLAPVGPVYQAGTMAANPVALAAGIATLNELKSGAPYQALERLGVQLEQEAQRAKIRVLRSGSMFWPYLDEESPAPLRPEQISERAVKRFKSSYARWLDRGVYLPPSAYEVGFLSAAHQNDDVTKLVNVLAEP